MKRSTPARPGPSGLGRLLDSSPVVERLVLVAVGLVVRLLYLVQASGYANFQQPYPGMDVALYDGLARRVAAGDLALGPGVYAFSPLYAYWLGGIYAVFGDSPWVVHTANLLFGLGTIACIHAIAGMLFKPRSVALIAGLGAALYGPYVVFDTSGLKTSLGLFLAALSFWAVLAAGVENRVRHWLGAGLALGLAYNLNGALGLFAAVVCGGLVVQRAVRPAAALVLGLFLAVLPFTLRNAVVAEEFAWVRTGGGLHFYIGNHERAWGGYREIPGIRSNPWGHVLDSRRIAERELGRPLSSGEVDAYWRERGMAFIRSHPSAFLGLVKDRALMLMNAYEIAANENYQYLTRRSWLLALLPRAGLLIPLALAGWGLTLVDFRRYWLIHVFLITQLGVLLVGLITWRYRVPLTLMFWPLAGFLLDGAVRWSREGRIRTVAAAAVLLCVTGWVSRIAIPDEASRGRRMRTAELKMELVEGIVRNRARIEQSTEREERIPLWLEVVESHDEAHDHEGASAILERALKEYPDSESLRWALVRQRAKLRNSVQE